MRTPVVLAGGLEWINQHEPTTFATIRRGPALRPHSPWRCPGLIGNEAVLPRVSRSDKHKRTRKVQQKSVCVSVGTQLLLCAVSCGNRRKTVYRIEAFFEFADPHALASQPEHGT